MQDGADVTQHFAAQHFAADDAAGAQYVEVRLIGGVTLVFYPEEHLGFDAEAWPAFCALASAEQVVVLRTRWRLLQIPESDVEVMAALRLSPFAYYSERRGTLQARYADYLVRERLAALEAMPQREVQAIQWRIGGQITSDGSHVPLLGETLLCREDTPSW